VKLAGVIIGVSLLFVGGALAARVLTATDSQPLPLKELAAIAHQSASSLGDPGVRTAVVFETTHKAALDVVSVGENPKNDPAAFKTPRVFLIVLRGHFKCYSCRGPSGAALPTGTVATLVWSPTRGTTDFGLSDRLPKPLSLLGRATILRLTK
jgi:hypothetical protein